MSTIAPYAGTVRVVLPGERRNVVVANPRKRGLHQFVTADGRSGGGERLEPTDVEIYRYRVAIVQLVKLKDGRLVNPVMVVKYSTFDEAGDVVLEDRWSVEQQGVSPNEKPNDGWADFAVSENIEKYLLLLTSFDEETGWRVLELEPEKIAEAKIIHIPDLLTLTPLEKHPQVKTLWKIHEQAAAEEDRLKRTE